MLSEARLEATGWPPGPWPLLGGGCLLSSPSTWPQRSFSGSSCGAEKGRQTARVGRARKQRTESAVCRK